MNIAVIPGSFDPCTKGHIDIIKRCSNIFDKVIVVVLVNKSKKTMFTLEQRKQMLASSLAKLHNVSVDYSEKLLVDYFKKVNATVLVKGIRNTVDFDYEYQLSLINKEIDYNIETLFMPCKPEFVHISSTAVKELLAFNSNIEGMVPKEAVNLIYKYIEGGN